MFQIPGAFRISGSGQIAFHRPQGAFFQPADLRLGDADLAGHFHLGASFKKRSWIMYFSRGFSREMASCRL